MWEGRKILFLGVWVSGFSFVCSPENMFRRQLDLATGFPETRSPSSLDSKVEKGESPKGGRMCSGKQALLRATWVSLHSRIFRKMCGYRGKRDVLQVSNITHRIAALRVSERKRVVYLMAEILPVSLPRLEICSWRLDIKFSVSFHLNRDFMTKVPRIRKDQFVVLLIRLKVRDRCVGHGAASE